MGLKTLNCFVEMTLYKNGMAIKIAKKTINPVDRKAIGWNLFFLFGINN